MRPRLLIIILLSVLTGHSIAATNPPSPFASDTADLLSNANIEGLKALPIHSLNIVKAGGRTFFMSDNGRFVITGTLLDVWNRVAVSELDQVDQVANRIDLSKMKLKIDDLGPTPQAVSRLLMGVAFFDGQPGRVLFECQGELGLFGFVCIAHFLHL